MAKTARFYETGAPDVMKVEDLPIGDPGAGEVRIRHEAVGCNFADTYFRSGLYPVAPPCGIGVEGAGVIEAVGEGVTSVSVGDRVSYNGWPLGAYASERVMRGLSATYWLKRANPMLKAGDTILLHAAAGGVGLLAVQIAKLMDLRVIGTVSSEEKAEKARSMGCDEIIFYRREDVPTRVKELTNGEGVSTVFDSVGKDTFEGSLKSLKRRGVLVGCGTASGNFPPIDAFQLMLQGSVYFIRPGFIDFYSDPAERAELWSFFFDHLASGRVKVDIGQKYALDDCVQAHRDLENGATIGSSIFVI